jgi:two-component system sensor histidine kinase AtoS
MERTTGQEETSRSDSCKDEVTLLGEFLGLLSINPGQDIHAALKDLLQKAKQCAGVDVLCIYHARAENPVFGKLAAIEKNKAFPKVIAADELDSGSAVRVWVKGDRADTKLQLYAQDNGLEYLLVNRLRQGEGLMGVIAAGGFQLANIPLVSKRLEVISGVVGSILQRYIFERYLKGQNEKLTWKKDLLDIAFQNTKDAVVILDHELRVVEVNQTAENILGYSIRDIRNSPVSDVLVGADGLMDALQVGLAGIETHELGIVSLHRRDGQAFSAHIRALPIIHEKDKPQGVMILISDESENQQNRLKAQHLEQRAALGSLASIFSHEVKNPINSIFLTVQLMQSWTDEGDRNFEPLKRIYDDCSRLRDLTESILSFSRPIGPTLKSIDLVAQLSGILERWRPRFERLNIESNPLFPEEPMIIQGDTRMIDQIFTNLITNAVDAMEKTGGTLSIKMRRNETVPRKPQVEIAVADTGPGMSEEWLEKVFQPFKTSKTKGTGLGLAITKQMVTALHGTIQAESFGIGCVFTVRFPAFTERKH